MNVQFAPNHGKLISAEETHTNQALSGFQNIKKGIK